MTERLLRVTAPRYVAGAVFRTSGGRWEIRECAPILAWMRKVPIAELAERLRRAGASHEWLETLSKTKKEES